MTDQELSEVLAHPRMRAYVERVAKEAALEAVSKAARMVGKTSVPRLPHAAPGDIPYVIAAWYLGCSRESIKVFVHEKQLVRGKLKGTVKMDSCIAFKARYKPRNRRG